MSTPAAVNTPQSMPEADTVRVMVAAIDFASTAVRVRDNKSSTQENIKQKKAATPTPLEIKGINSASSVDLHHQALLCDPQTSGGLLIAVDTNSADAVSALLASADCYHLPIGSLFQAAGDNHIEVAA